jgi:uncharacterized protein (DUF983 family)
VRPRPSVALLRGLRKRCPRCGTRAPFHRHVRLTERCPRCGVQFAREEGFWTGVYLVNYGLTAVILIGALFVFIIAHEASDGGGSIVPFIAIGVVLTIAFPLWFYPRAVMTWVALDELLRPLEPTEEAEAATYAAAQEELPDAG